MSSGPVLTRNDGLTMRTTGMLDAPTTRALAHELEVQFFAERGIDCVRHVGQAMCRGRRGRAQPLRSRYWCQRLSASAPGASPQTAPLVWCGLGSGGAPNLQSTNRPAPEA